jgi:uncharacterized lipoprotein YehR (DUF1307 family)
MNKKASFIVVALMSIVVLAGCGSKSSDVTVIGNSSSQEKMATPAPSK